MFADLDESIALTPRVEGEVVGVGPLLGASNTAGIPIRAAPSATVPAARVGYDAVKYMELTIEACINRVERERVL